MDQNKIGQHIEELRKRKGLTQKDLAKELGLSNTAISKWENGYNLPDISMLSPLSKVLDVDIMEIIEPERIENIDEIPLDNTISNKHQKFHLITIIILITIILIGIFTFNRIATSKETNEKLASNIKVYEISSNDKYLYVKGYLIFNSEESRLILNDIRYENPEKGTDEEIKTSEITMYVKFGNQITYRIEFTTDDQKQQTLNKIFNTLSIDETIKTKIEILKAEKEIVNSEIEIQYANKKRKFEELKFKLLAKEQFT